MVEAFASHKVVASPRTCPVDFDGCTVFEVDGEEVAIVDPTSADSDASNADD
jgi:hypothetical protein